MTAAPSPAASTFWSPVLVVVGDVPELAEVALDGVRPERVTLRALHALPPCVATILIDLRSVPFGDVVAWRTGHDESTAPLVLVSDRQLGEDAIDGVRADDVHVLPRDGTRCFARRLRGSLAWGRARLDAAFAEQALSESASGFTVVDTSSPNTPIVAVSPGLERLTYYAARDLTGKSSAVLQRDDAQAGASALAAAIRAQERATVLVRCYRRDGTMFWNEITVFPLLLGGRPTPWVGAAHHDVTALVEARAQIGSLYQRLVDQRTFDHAILDGVDVGIITTDRQGELLFANRCAMNLLGQASVTQGIQVADVLHLPCLPDALLEREARWTARHTVVTVHGEVELDMTLSRADGANDGNIGFYLIFHDSREERQRAEEHRRFERLAALGTMVAGFAHEVRNPVAALRSIAEELGEELTQAGLMLPHAGRMLRVLERMERLVRSSLRFGRPAVPRRAVHRPWVLCSGALTALSPRLLGRELHVEIDADLPSVFVDEGQIVQALVVLLDNALDAEGSPEGVSIKAYGPRAPDSERPRSSIPVTSQMVRFEVTDNGPGISATDLPRIFDPFFTTKASGTGLGLSIAQQLVSENGGRIEVSSARGGTTFTILVPTHDSRSIGPGSEH